MTSIPLALRSIRGVIGVCLASSLCSGCGESEIESRDIWLSRTLIEDHFHLIARVPELVEGKFNKMRGVFTDDHTSLYPYMRGTLSQMYRDLAGDNLALVPSRFASPEGLLIFSVGDPHIENLSCTPDEGGRLGLDWDDFDSAGYGPWIWDVRRLTLSWWVFARELNPSRYTLKLTEQVIQGYLRGVSDWRSGLRAQPREGSPVPLLVRDLFLSARERAVEGRIMDRYTTLNEAGQRVLRRGHIRPVEQTGVIRDALAALSEHEAVLIRGVLQRLSEQGVDRGPLKDVTRKFGQGVSSYPLMRFYLLFEGPTEGQGDDELWEVKELADRPVPPELSLTPPRQFGRQGARVLGARRALQWGPLASLQHPVPSTWVDVGNASFRVRRRVDLQQGLSVRELTERWRSAEGEEGLELAMTELEALASLSGQLLAGAHCFAPTLHGNQGGSIIEGDIARGGERELIEETLLFVERYGPQLERDRATLIRLMERRGPLLGARSVE